MINLDHRGIHLHASVIVCQTILRMEVVLLDIRGLESDTADNVGEEKEN